MRILNKFRGTRGWISAWEQVVRFRDMITDAAMRRARILAFWEKFGLEATREAFRVKRRALFGWKRMLREGGGKLEALNPASRAPRRRRKRIWDIRILGEIKRLRGEHPNLGKEKLYPLLAEFSRREQLVCPKPRTIGRIVQDLGGLRMFPRKVSHFGAIREVTRQQVPRKPHDFRALYPGHCIGLDTVEEVIHGSRRYVITCEDLFGRFAFAWATSSHASQAAAEFFAVFRELFPYPVTFVLTDNGSEWKKHFAAELERLPITHCRTYPRTPKMNAHVERFNRTLREEFLNYHRGLLLDPDILNRKLMDYLIWYNTKRVHHAFGNKLTPVQFLLSWKPVEEARLPAECKNGWPHTGI